VIVFPNNFHALRNANVFAVSGILAVIRDSFLSAGDGYQADGKWAKKFGLSI
jgi:hypothetical protein